MPDATTGSRRSRSRPRSCASRESSRPCAPSGRSWRASGTRRPRRRRSSRPGRGHATTRGAARHLAEVTVVEAERRTLARRLAALTAAREALRSAEAEAAALARDAELFGPEALAEIDGFRERRGARPQALREARIALGAARAEAERAERDRLRLFGEALRLSDEERRRARTLLDGSIEAAEERSAAETALAAQWEELRKEGLADDLAKLEALPPAERSFVAAADDERGSRELEGVKLDRKVADAAALVSIITGERRERVTRARALVVVAGILVPVVLVLALTKASFAVTVSAGVFAFALGVFGGVAWFSGSRHRLAEQARARGDETSHRQKAAEVRRRLSDLRQRLERTARGAGFPDASSLVQAHRRLRAADELRRALLSRTAQRDAASDRVRQLSAELASLAPALGLPDGPPPPEAARRALAFLSELETRLEEDRTASAVLAREEERLAREGADLAALEDRLRAAFARAGAPPGLAVAEAFAFVEAGRRRAARWKELLEVELPARREAVRDEEIGELTERVASLAAEVLSRLGSLGADETALPEAAPEAARRAAAVARAALEAAEGECLAAERELGAAARRGGERARACEESLDEAEAFLVRATLFRDALDLAHRTLTGAAAAVYGDFRRGLSRASRAILESWRVPYEALEFSDDLSLTAVARGGRVSTKGEIESALSTGAREQLHLTARLAVLRYLGTGAEGVPLLLDDPLTGADDERFVSVMRFLASNVLAERPVLLVSCHGWRHEKLLEALPAEVSARLTRVSLATFSSKPAVAAESGPSERTSPVRRPDGAVARDRLLP